MMWLFMSFPRTYSYVDTLMSNGIHYKVGTLGVDYVVSVGAWWMRLTPMKGTPGDPSLLWLRTQWEAPGRSSALTLMFDVTSTTVRNEFLLFPSHSVWGILLWQHTPQTVTFHGFYPYIFLCGLCLTQDSFSVPNPFFGGKLSSLPGNKWTNKTKNKMSLQVASYYILKKNTHGSITENH